MGVELYNIFEGRKEVPSLRILERYRVDYRDDNRIIWHYEDMVAFWWSMLINGCPIRTMQLDLIIPFLIMKGVGNWLFTHSFIE
jgi:hypothetical protein